MVSVVNCFWIYIFDKIPTGSDGRAEHHSRCELLLNLYLWQDSNRFPPYKKKTFIVVNCFWIYIFDKIPTGMPQGSRQRRQLWIAFEFISLTRFQQERRTHRGRGTVVNCFWIYIFDKIPTGMLTPSSSTVKLWIAFEFISLTRFQQGGVYAQDCRSCELLLNLYLWQDSNRFNPKFWYYDSCELLLNLYLWQDSNRKIRQRLWKNMLWIAFEFISLTRFQQVSTFKCGTI